MKRLALSLLLVCSVGLFADQCEDLRNDLNEFIKLPVKISACQLRAAFIIAELFNECGEEQDFQINRDTVCDKVNESWFGVSFKECVDSQDIAVAEIVKGLQAIKNDTANATRKKSELDCARRNAIFLMQHVQNSDPRETVPAAIKKDFFENYIACRKIFDQK